MKKKREKSDKTSKRLFWGI